jgi:hypothetical protein
LLGELLEGKLHEQFLWGGAGNGRGSSAPRQSLTRQLFFKWIKQHLRIKAFYGYSENAVKTQVWIAVAIYVLVAILKKRLDLDASLHEILQVLSVTLFEQVPILQAFGDDWSQEELAGISNQLKLPGL